MSRTFGRMLYVRSRELEFDFYTKLLATTPPPVPGDGRCRHSTRVDATSAKCSQCARVVVSRAREAIRPETILELSYQVRRGHLRAYEIDPCGRRNERG